MSRLDRARDLLRYLKEAQSTLQSERILGPHLASNRAEHDLKKTYFDRVFGPLAPMVLAGVIKMTTVEEVYAFLVAKEAMDV